MARQGITDPDMGGKTMPTKAFHPLDLDALFARNSAIYGDFRMEAAADGEQQQSGEGQGDGSSSSGDAKREDQSGDKGYPSGTPLEQMTAEQQASYWKTQSRKHEDRAKSFGSLTPEQVASLKDKAEKHDALERELMSDKDKAVAEAKDAAGSEAREKFLPRLAQAELKAAAAGKVSAERLAAATEFVDLRHFLNGEDVDSDKVAKFIDSLGPDASTDQQRQGRRGPSSAGAGQRQSSAAPSLSAGQDAYARRHGKKSA